MNHATRFEAASSNALLVPKYRENISIAFYFNDKKENDPWYIRWFKSDLKYRHTEIAFPMSMYRQSGAKGSRATKDKLFAYGVFADHTDDIRGAILVHSDESTFVFDVKEVRNGIAQRPQRLTLVSDRGWKDITEKKIRSLNCKDNPMLSPEDIAFDAYRSKGKVSVTWARPDRPANRFTKGGQSYAEFVYYKERQTLKLEIPGIAFGKPRDFGNPAYTWIHLNVPYENASLAAQFAEKQVGKPHDNTGIYWAMVWPRSPNYQSYYCVNFVVSVLQMAGVLDGTNPCGVLPDDLYEMLKDHPDRVTAANPYLTAKIQRSIEMPRPFYTVTPRTKSTSSSSFQRRRGDNHGFSVPMMTPLRHALPQSDAFPSHPTHSQPITHDHASTTSITTTGPLVTWKQPTSSRSRNTLRKAQPHYAHIHRTST